MTLTPIEQKVYKAFYNGVCTLEQVKELLKNYRQAVVACKNLVAKHYFKRIKGGLYAAVPFELAPDSNNAFSPDRYKVADLMIKDRFLSHHTALELLAGAEKIPTVYISSPSRVPDVHCAGIDYRIITTKHFFGFKDYDHNGTMIKVSDKERTIIDCLRQIKFTNGFEELQKILPKLAPLNFETLLHYLQKIDEMSLYTRVGYAMDIMKEGMETPQHFLDAVQSKIGKRSYYLDPS
ncbi:MAG: hypothetical protein ABIH34_08190, partial [Nanoarchaeota archaeon]